MSTLITYKINRNFKKKYYESLINPCLLRFTITIIDNRLIFHASDEEFVQKVLTRNNLPYRHATN